MFQFRKSLFTATLLASAPVLAANSVSAANAVAEVEAISEAVSDAVSDTANTVTVTATRTPQRIVDAPATVSVITAEDIQNNLMEDIKDLVRFEPGIDVRSQPSRPGAALGTTGRDGNSGFTVRGLLGNRVLLQHLLVAEKDGKSFVIKHWRQDWEYEPEQVLTYKGPDQWTFAPVPERMRKGRWSQTVWQTDDSPRYGGWGEFSDEGGVIRWRSNWTWRPLARRDAVRKPVYDRYMAINRHQPTPTGWIHWQDNMKMAADKPIVQESGLNTYAKFEGFDASRADAYWAATSQYWAIVRAAWAEVAARDGGIQIKEQADWGSVTSERLMTMADEIEKGALTVEVAGNSARDLILTATAAQLASR